MLMLSDFYAGRYKTQHDSLVVGTRIDEYIVEPYGQESYDVYRLFVDAAGRKSAIVYDFPCNTVLIVREEPLLTCDDFGSGLYNTNMELRRVWVEATSDAWGNLNSLMAENWEGQRFLLAHFPRDVVFIGREKPC
jgi:hypothetical protein